MGVTEQDWFLASVDIPDMDVGFDLDGENTQCDSECINDGEGGVDNRLGAVGNGLEGSIGDACGEFFLCRPQHAVDTGLLVLLLKTRLGADPEGQRVFEAYVYDGVDTDGDPSDNASGEETFEVTRDSVNVGGVDPLEDAAFGFDQGGQVDEDGYWFEPIGMMIVRFRLPGEIWHAIPIWFPFHLYDAHLIIERGSGSPRGMVGGGMMVEEWAEALTMPEVASALEIDPSTILNILVNQADLDLVPEGPTGEACVIDDDCPLPWQPCDTDGQCHEPAGQMDSISIAMTFEAVPCEITGVAE